MKEVILALGLAALATSAQAHEITPPSQPTLSADSAEHGGGCRKDSPAGQCCHAGKQPYHCH